jgi:hypothetical protein
MSAARDAIDTLFSGGVPARPIYVPLFTSLAARVRHTTQRAMTGDAALWAAAAAQTAELFDLDAIALAADPVLCAEACGAPVAWDDDVPRLVGRAASLAESPRDGGRLPTLLEAARRACATGRAQRGCIAAITGPLTLAGQLFGPQDALAEIGRAKQCVTSVLEALCEVRPDLIVLVEGAVLGAGPPQPAVRRAYHTLKNVTGYFDIPLAVTLEAYAPGEAAAFATLPCDVWILGSAADGSAPAIADGRALGAEARALGVCMPPAANAALRETLARWRRDAPTAFYTSIDTAQDGHDIDQVHAFVRALRQS